MATSPKHLTLKMDKDKHAKLKDIAVSHNLSMNFLLEVVLDNFIQDYESKKVTIQTGVALIPINVNPADSSATIQPTE